MHWTLLVVYTMGEVASAHPPQQSRIWVDKQESRGGGRRWLSCFCSWLVATSLHPVLKWQGLVLGPSPALSQRVLPALLVEGFSLYSTLASDFGAVEAAPGSAGGLVLFTGHLSAILAPRPFCLLIIKLWRVPALGRAFFFPFFFCAQNVKLQKLKM